MYLDEEVWAAVRRTRRRVALTFGTMLILLFIGIALGVITLR
jgi:ABC-type lipoprotein release transport system permease subunit